MKLFVTGASGYLGTALLKRAPQDWMISGTYLTHPFPNARGTSVLLDVRDADAVSQAVAQAAPNVIIHTAAAMQGDTLTSVNVEGSRHVARAAAHRGARLIHLSTDVIFDGEHAPYDEDSAAAPITPYGISKALAESAVLAECPSAVIVRTSLIYGFKPLDLRTNQVLNGEMPILFTDEYRCPICVDDLALALLELARNDYAGVLNVAGPQSQSRYDFGLKLAAAFGVTPRFLPALSASSPVLRPRNCTLDISRAQSLLHTSLRGVDRVLRELPLPS